MSKRYKARSGGIFSWELHIQLELILIEPSFALARHARNPTKKVGSENRPSKRLEKSTFTFSRVRRLFSRLV